jgi:hydrogenase maturation protease
MLAQLTNSYPQEVLLIGCQPEELEDYGGSLRPRVKAALEAALPVAIERIAAWGGQPRRRQGPPASAERVNVASIGLAAYESGRPDAETACRVGDARFMARPGV